MHIRIVCENNGHRIILIMKCLINIIVLVTYGCISEILVVLMKYWSDRISFLSSNSNSYICRNICFIGSSGKEITSRFSHAGGHTIGSVCFMFRGWLQKWLTCLLEGFRMDDKHETTTILGNSVVVIFKPLTVGRWMAPMQTPTD